MKQHSWKWLTTVLMIALVGLLMVACGNDTTAPDEKKGEEPAQENNAQAQGEAPSIEGTTIQIIATSKADDVFAEFTKDTGVKVEYLDMSSGEVIARVRAEGGKPAADVWFGGGIDAFLAAKDEGFIQPYLSPETEHIPAMYFDPEGYWAGFDKVITGFIVNTDVLKEKGLTAPATWNDLAKPEYQGEILMSSPAISGTNYAVVNGLIQAKGDEAWDIFHGIGENAPFFGKRGSEPSNKTVAGEVGVGITYINGGIIQLMDEHPVQVIYPEDGIPWVPACISIFNGTDNLDGSKAFVDWVLSKKGQEFLRDYNQALPVRDDVEMPEILKDFPADRLYEVDFSLFGTQRDAILTRWAEEVEKQ